MRRLAGLVVGIMSVALVAAPVAVASSTTITARAGTQFSGPVDTAPGCSSATSIAIKWGDGSETSTGAYDSSGNVIGTHTYASGGTYSGGTVTFSGGNCGTTPADTFTANVAKFTQCPTVYFDQGCQTLITVSDSGETVVADPTQGPYEGADDSLIGVVNNSSSPIFELPLSVPSSSLFSFEGDGICDPGGPPLLSGCAPTSQTPAGTACGVQSNGCAFPTPTGQNSPPPGYAETGYEGPTTWFSNISPDSSSGQVNFSPPLQPNQSTYFSLEEPPTGTTIGVGGTAPFSPGAVPPTVTGSTGATFTGIVNPNGSATTAYFQYGIVLAHRAPGDPTTTYYLTTPVQAVGSDFANHTVTAPVTGLVPNATYNVQLVASNAAGTTYGPNETFTTLKDPPPPPPVLGKTVNVTPVLGVVFIKPPPGKTLGGAGDSAALSKGQGFVPLTEARAIPTGSEIDALHGSLKIVTATGNVGKTQNATLAGGAFKINQSRSKITKGLTNFSLVEGGFTGAPTYATCKAKGKKKSADQATIAALSSKTLQLLKARAHGRFKTTGRYSSATVRGTIWTIADRCNGTFTHVIRDTVVVNDFVRHVTVILHSGQSYLAKKP